jgi:ABC-2 type transport system permease protein
MAQVGLSVSHSRGQFMISRIARKEFIEMIRDGRFRWTAAVVLGLLIVSLLMGWKNHRAIAEQHQSAQRETREHWLDQGQKNPHSAAHYGIYAFKPRMPLSLVDTGVDAYTGVASYLEAHKQNEFKYRPAQDGTAVQRFGELTAAAVLQILLPLIIILLSFSAFAGEREQGTLRQLLSLGLTGRELALGKAFGIAGALGVLLIPATIIGVIALALTSENGAISASLPRMLIMGASYLVYFGIFVAVSLAVSAKAPSARLALVVLLAFWIVNSLIAPRAVSDLSKRIYPTPSSFEFAQGMHNDLENGIDGHNPEDQRQKELEARVLNQYNVSKLEDLPVSFAGIALQESEEYGNLVFDKHYNELWNRFEKQNRLQQIAAIIAPMLAARSLSMSMSGTDFAQHRDFASAAENYRRQFVKMMNDDMTYKAGKADFSYLAAPALWQTVPEFLYEAPAATKALKNQIISITVLSLWFIIACAVAFATITRMKID